MKPGGRSALTVLMVVASVLAMSLAANAVPDGTDVMRLSVIFTNDIHGGIDRSGATFMNREFPPPLGGAASAVTYV